MCPYEKEPITFTIANKGKTGLYYVWSADESQLRDQLKIRFDDQEGYITSGSQAKTTVTITPIVRLDLSRFKFNLKVLRNQLTKSLIR